MAEEPSRTRRRIDYLRDRSGGPTAAPAPVPPAVSGHDPRFPGWRREGEFLLRRRIVHPGLAVEPWPEVFLPVQVTGDDLLFYDTETTGLSGGSGTMIFLFGAAWCEGPDLVVEQLFLSDFPGEAEFLLAVRDLLGRFRVFESYNGKTFDSHVLRTRFLMNRIPWEPGPQVDLLHHARRLWKVMTRDCSLTTIEAKILGFTRERDVAGEEIPGIWLEFLRTGRGGDLPTVFDHNAMDIVSLARVHAVIGRKLSGDRGGAPVDEKALGQWMLRRASSTGAVILAKAYADGNVDAGIPLSLHHRRRREWDQAVAIWESMLTRSRSLFAAIELAKHVEHRERNPGKALDIIETLLSWQLPLDRRMREELRRRVERLNRKVTGRKTKVS